MTLCRSASSAPFDIIEDTTTGKNVTSELRTHIETCMFTDADEPPPARWVSLITPSKRTAHVHDIERRD